MFYVLNSHIQLWQTKSSYISLQHVIIILKTVRVVKNICTQSVILKCEKNYEKKEA